MDDSGTMAGMGSLLQLIHAARTSVLVAAVGVIATAGCHDKVLEFRSVDLVASGSLIANGSRLPARELVAEDETWATVPLAAGGSATAEVDLFEHAKMTVAGIVQCAEGSHGSTGSLEISIHGGTREASRELEVSAGHGWWSRQIDLGDVAGGPARLNIQADFPNGCSVQLREATIHHARRVESTQKAARSQVLLISVDTLRFDIENGLDECDRIPGLGGLAAEAECWTNAYAAASWTKPSHASLLTGFHPDTHRAMLMNQAIDSALPTLAERFRQAGFATAGLVYDCTWLSPRWGFAKGFDEYRVTRWRASRQARHAAEWMLDRRDEDFFFFLHTFEPHSDFAHLPYEAPGVNRGWIAERFGVNNFGCRGGVCAASLVNALARGEVQRQESDVAILRETYDRGVRYTGAALAELFETLVRSGVWDDLVVVVTSDHGEEFAEHGGFGHHTVYEEILRVPLVIKWPDGARAGDVNHTPCSALDIAPTLLRHFDLPATHLPGLPLRKRTGEIPVIAGTLEKAVILEGYKGIFNEETPPKVFDLASDPGETLNLAENRPELEARLRRILADEIRRALDLHARLGSGGAESQVVLSERDRQRLEAFGYLQ